jgi:CDP-diacylglycerol--glycerol-3-phosphate 3-phosphatidyltransferase
MAPGFHGLVQLRRRRGQAVRELPPSTCRGVIGGFLFGYLFVCLAPLFPPPATTLAGWFVAAAILGSFGRDWLVLVGRIDPVSAEYRICRARLRCALFEWLPVIVRLSLAAAGSWFIVEAFGRSAGWVPYMAEQGFSAPRGAATVAAVVTACVLGAIVLGFSGRVAALFLFVIAGLDYGVRSSGTVNAFVLSGSVLILLLGTGRWSLWSWEEKLPKDSRCRAP